MFHQRYFYLIILSLNLIGCQAQEWTAPFFQDANTPKVVLTPPESTGGDFTIRMDEEIEFPYALVKIKYDGTLTPSMSLIFGSSIDLGNALVKGSNEWIINITKRQDYENEANRFYKMRVTVGTIFKEINILVNNIFDNDPIITINGPCQINELEDPNYETNCQLELLARDGLLNNQITYKIVGNNNEENLFDLTLKNADDYKQFYNIVVKETLHYEERSFYNFKIIFYDIVCNSGEILIIIQLNDLPNMPPLWIKPFTIRQFNELTTQNFAIEATDGDTGINERIEYYLSFADGHDYSRFFELKPNATSNEVIVHVKPINRDVEKQEYYNFDIYAYKNNNKTWSTRSECLIIIVDINNQIPAITLSTNVINIRESEFRTLPFEYIIVDDLDLGPHASYTVKLSQANNALQEYSSAFSIIPNSGYQRADYFSINVMNAKLIDFEDDDWRSFELMIISTETNITTHTDSKTFQINLINWNDELPIFLNENGEYSISVNETIAGNLDLIAVYAKDRDIGDSVIHSIVGSMSNVLNINERSGMISTINDNTFDYESQQEILLQVMAEDTLELGPTHKTFARLTITVLDENDETPILKLPRVTPNVVEHQDAAVVSSEIVATDPDTTAHLEFEIWWNESYATKSGQDAKKSLYENCFYIRREEINRNMVIGHLTITPEFDKRIDYEEYEVIYLYIRAIDRNQQYNQDYADGMLTIRIEDINDCPPEFVGDTLLVERRVTELAYTDTLIGTITAIDRDGPGNNIIEYSMEPADDSPPSWITIDQNNGAIRVNANLSIDCDIPPQRQNLKLSVILFDGVHTVKDDIIIAIIDTNNKQPTFGEFRRTIYMEEKIHKTGYEIEQIKTDDRDRDEIFHTVVYKINSKDYPDLLKFFKIDLFSGMIELNLQNVQLDRDEGNKTHEIRLIIEDNHQGFGPINYNYESVQIILIDVNDHWPVMPDDFELKFNENMPIGSFSNDLCAIDIDDAENARITYEIISILPKANNAMPPPQNINNVFKMLNKNNCGKIETDKLLKGFYGLWDVVILAYDHGDNDVTYGRQERNKTFTLTVEEYNFNNPKITYPIQHQSFRLRYTNQVIGTTLYLLNDSELHSFDAFDPDGGIFGKVKFDVKSTNNNDDGDYFQMSFSETNGFTHSSNLMLKQKIPRATTFELTISAIDGGDLQSEPINIKVTFVNTEGDPYFEVLNHNIKFSENSTGMEEYQLIPEAKDPLDAGKEEDDEKEIIHYFIDQTYKPEDSKYFTIDKLTRNITLVAELDREEIDEHEFKVIAARPSANGLPSEISKDSILLVVVTVIDVNDNPPVFDSYDYGAGITTSDYLNKTLLTVKATDRDLDDVVTYFIVPGSLKTDGKNIGDIKETAFILDSETGIILLNFIPQKEMSGYIEFKVEARDLVLHTDTTTVKIFIITDVNRVSFIFLNTVDQIKADDNIQFLKDVFEKNFKYTCYIDDVNKADINGITQEGLSNVRAHFTQNNEAILAEKIQSLASDSIFITTLKSELIDRLLNLQDVPSKNTVQEAANTAELLQTILIVVSVVLGLLCVVLIVTFFIRVKKLKRELRAVTTADVFGSTSSNLNRREAPTTNVFSVQGSNPVLNKNDTLKGVFDNISIQSDESDFNDLVDDPTFMSSERRASINPALIEEIRRKSVNPMVNL